MKTKTSGPYCRECDRVFDTIPDLNRHLAMAAKHTKKYDKYGLERTGLAPKPMAKATKAKRDVPNGQAAAPVILTGSGCQTSENVNTADVNTATAVNTADQLAHIRANNEMRHRQLVSEVEALDKQYEVYSAQYQDQKHVRKQQLEMLESENRILDQTLGDLKKITGLLYGVKMAGSGGDPKMAHHLAAASEI